MIANMFDNSNFARNGVLAPNLQVISEHKEECLAKPEWEVTTA